MKKRAGCERSGRMRMRKGGNVAELEVMTNMFESGAIAKQLDLGKTCDCDIKGSSSLTRLVEQNKHP